jgi:hypothetical protein
MGSVGGIDDKNRGSFKKSKHSEGIEYIQKRLF